MRCTPNPLTPAIPHTSRFELRSSSSARSDLNYEILQAMDKISMPKKKGTVSYLYVLVPLRGSMYSDFSMSRVQRQFVWERA